MRLIRTRLLYLGTLAHGQQSKEETELSNLAAMQARRWLTFSLLLYDSPIGCSERYELEFAT